MAGDILQLSTFLSAAQEQDLAAYRQAARAIEFPSTPGGDSFAEIAPHFSPVLDSIAHNASLPAERFIGADSTPEDYAEAIQAVTFQDLFTNIRFGAAKHMLARWTGRALKAGDEEAAEQKRQLGYDFIAARSALAISGLLVACDRLRRPVGLLGEEQPAWQQAKDTYQRSKKPTSIVINVTDGQRFDELIGRAHEYREGLASQPGGVALEPIKASRFKAITVARVVRYAVGGRLHGKTFSEMTDDITRVVVEKAAPNTTEEERRFAVHSTAKYTRYVAGAASINPVLAHAPHVRAAVFLQRQLEGMDDQGERLTFDRDIRKFAR